MSDNFFSNFFWRLFERVGALGISFIVSLLVARVIGPESYGLVSIVMVFISFFQIFIDGGFTAALIQRKNADDVDFSSVFYINIFSCILIYIIVYFLSPNISHFYHLPELTNMIRVLGISLLIFGVKSIQQAYASRYMLFKNFFYATLIGTICAAIVGVAMAYNGFGAWSMIFQYLVNNFVDTIILWIFIEWRPKLIFSLDHAIQLFSYGYKLFLSSLIDNIYSNINKLLIGKYYSSSDLAYYDKGSSFPNTIVDSINSSIDSVLLPSLSKNQENLIEIRNMSKNIIKRTTFIIFPLMFTIFACSNNLIIVFLTEKWIGSSIYLRLFCIVYCLYPIHTLNLNIIKAIGRSDIFLKLEILKKISLTIILLITIRISPFAMACGVVINSCISLVLNTFPNNKIIGYGVFEQLKDILPNIILSILIIIIIPLLDGLSLRPVFVLLIQILCALLMFIIYGVIFNFKELNFFMNKILGLFNINFKK